MGKRALLLFMSVLVAIGFMPSIAFAANGIGGREAADWLSTQKLSNRSESVGGIVQIALGSSTSAALMSDGSLWTWGCHGGAEDEDSATPFKIMEDVKQVSLGVDHSAALKEDGSVWMWGADYYGQIGDGPMSEAGTMPVKVLDDAVQVSLGNFHSAALKADGSLWMWGSNRYGQIGDGTTENRMAPIKVMDGVSQVALGGWYSSALKSDGSLWTWGENYGGALGYDGGEYNAKPFKVMDDVSRVSFGCVSSTSAVEKNDGSWWIWGYNEDGQFGDGTTENAAEPRRFMDASNQVSFGGHHVAALMNDGSLYMWGHNDSGALGDGTRSSGLAPAKLMSGVSQVSLGYDYSAALNADGSLWLWGNNGYGQIGDGTTEDRLTPTCIFSDGTWHSANVGGEADSKGEVPSADGEGQAVVGGGQSEPDVGESTDKVSISPETLWAGCEYMGSVNLVNFPSGAKITKVKSSKPKVIRAMRGGSGKYDNQLTPLKAGKSKISVTYKYKGETKTVSATYRVKKYPNPYKSVLVNGKKVNTKKSKYFYDVKNYKKTTGKVKVKPAKGWKIAESYGVLGDRMFTVESGASFKVPKGKDVSAFFVLRNSAGDRIRYGVRFMR